MKRIFFILTFIIITNTLFSQVISKSEKLNVERYKKYSLDNYLYYQQKKINGIYIGYGVIFPFFFNSNYEEKIVQKDIKYKYGNTFNFMFKYYPISIKGYYFSTFYNCPSLQSIFSDNTAVRYRGISFDFNLSLFPFFSKFKKISSFIVPYVGLGYQFTNLVFLENKYLFWSTLSSTNMNTAIGNLGIDFNFSKYVTITIEYSKSFNLKDNNYGILATSLYINFKY